MAMKVYLIILTAYWMSAAVGGDKSIQERTYLHTKINRTCMRCEPGYFREAHCTLDDQKAKCKPCGNGTYQSVYNIATSCEPCLKYCKTDREYLVENCSATTNNVCVCLDGYYRFEGPEGLCTEDFGCPPGMGVTQQGTPFQKTQCKICEEGYFSPNFSRTQICQPCSQCPDGYKPKSPCTKDKDVHCVPQHEIEVLPIVLGCVFGFLFIVIVILVCICVCARKGRGPKLLQKLCHKSSESDPESIPAEKHPLAPVDKNTSHSNGIKNGDVLDNPSSSLHEDLPGVVSDKMLLNLSHDLISLDWPFFFRHLIGDAADSHIDETIIDNKGVKEQIYQLLKKWKHLEKGEATLENIVAALKQCGKNDLAVKYSRRKSTDV